MLVKKSFESFKAEHPQGITAIAIALRHIYGFTALSGQFYNVRLLPPIIWVLIKVNLVAATMQNPAPF